MRLGLEIDVVRFWGAYLGPAVPTIVLFSFFFFFLGGGGGFP